MANLVKTVRKISPKDTFESCLNQLIKSWGLGKREVHNPKIIEELAKCTELTLDQVMEIKVKSGFNYLEAVKESLKKRYFVDPPNYTEEDLDRIDETLEAIENQPQHKQRSIEWYEYRHSHLTASDAGNATQAKGYSNYTLALKKKIMSLEEYMYDRENNSLGGKPAIKHGVMLEDVAVALYEKHNNVKVKEFGCLEHPTKPYLAASPDGIVFSRDTNPNFHGRMLEIKCPFSRTITGIPLKEYYMQVQQQLDVCDLDYCDFLECDLRIYDSLGDFLRDSPNSGESYTKTKSGGYKGLLFEYREKGSKSSSYVYSDLNLESHEVREWSRNLKKQYRADPNIDFHQMIFWKCVEYNETLLDRNYDFFDELETKLRNFWDKVEYYRRIGYDKFAEDFLNEKKPKNINIDTIEKHLEIRDDHQSINYLQITQKEQDDYKNLEFIDIQVDIDSDENININNGQDFKKEKEKKESSRVINSKSKPRRKKIEQLDFIDIEIDDLDNPKPEEIKVEKQNKLELKKPSSLMVVVPE